MTTIRASIVCLFVSVAGNAAATPDPDRSMEAMFARGVRLFALGRYEESIQSFEKGYVLKPHNNILYNIAVARVRLGELQLRLDNPDARQQFIFAADVLRHLQDRQQSDSRARPKIQSMIASADTKADALRKKDPVEPEESAPKPKATDQRDEATQQNDSVAQAPAAEVSQELSHNRKYGLIFTVAGVLTFAGSMIALKYHTQYSDQIDYELNERGIWTEKLAKLSDKKDALGWITPALITASIASIGVGVYFFMKPVRTAIRTIYIRPGLGGASVSGTF